MNPPGPGPLASLQQELREFVAERDWDQFHSPKNLATALSVEAAELLENFQWLGEEDSAIRCPFRSALKVPKSVEIAKERTGAD